MANRDTTHNLNTSNSDSECESPDQRVNRFLSVFDPEEIKKFAQMNTSIVEEDENCAVEVPARASGKPDSKKPAKTNAQVSDAKNDKKIKTYHDGSGIPQNVKAEIIRNIIRNIDVDGYVNKMLASDIVEIKLDEKYFEF